MKRIGAFELVMAVMDVVNRVLRLIDLYARAVQNVSVLMNENATLKQELADSKAETAAALADDIADKDKIAKAEEAVYAAVQRADEAAVQLKQLQDNQPAVVAEAEEIKKAFQTVADKLPEETNQPIELNLEGQVPQRAEAQVGSTVIVNEGTPVTKDTLP